MELKSGTKKRQAFGDLSQMRINKKVRYSSLETQESLNLSQIRNKLKHHFSAYSNGITQARSLIEQINLFKEQVNEVEFVLLCVPFNKNLSFFFRSTPQEDIFFQWILNQLEQCIEQFPHYDEFNDITKKLIRAICHHQVYFAAVLDRPKIKTIIHQYYAMDLTQYFFLEKRIKVDPWLFLKKYFPDALINKLKVNPCNINGATILDILAENYIEYLPELWRNGFRSSDQKRLNYYIFSNFKDTSFSKVRKVYQEILSHSELEDFLCFSEQHCPIVLFLRNGVVDVHLFKIFLEKTASIVTVDGLMNCFFSTNSIESDALWDYLSKPTYFTHFIDKVIYSLSILKEASLKIPASSQFQEKLKSELQVYGTDIEVAFLQPEPTLADEILFYCAQVAAQSMINDPKIVDNYYKQVNKLMCFLEEKNSNKSNLTRILLNISLIYSVVVRKRNFNVTLFLRSIDSNCHFISGILPDEQQKILSDFMLFSAKGVSQLNRQLQLYNSDRLERFFQFVTQLITIMPEQKDMKPSAFFSMARLLYVLKIQNETSDLRSIINTFFSPFNSWSNKDKFIANILACFLVRTALYQSIDCQLIDLISEVEPIWINYVSTEYIINERTYNLFSVSIHKFLIQDHVIVEKHAAVIIHILDKIMERRDISLPRNFLEAVADWQLNLLKKAQLGEVAQKLLEEIYNKCLHKVQGSPEEAFFEEIRTQLLLRFDADPTKDPQAIHTRENHNMADTIYLSWLEELGDSEAVKVEKICNAMDQFQSYIHQKKLEQLKQLIRPFKDSPDKLVDYITHIYGDNSVENSLDFQEIDEQLLPYTHLKMYLEQIKIYANQHQDAEKLFNMIGMTAYYSVNQVKMAQFGIHNGEEALNILLNELLDQVANPSCTQGPFIRLFIALEPVSDYKFPYLTRRSIQFYVKEYINNHYEQLNEEAKKNLIVGIYEKIEEQETLEQIDFIPENAFKFLIAPFLNDNSGRLGYISVKEIEDLFYWERPEVYHPTLVAALNQYHQEKRNNIYVNPNGFFSGRSSNNDNFSNCNNCSP